MSPARKCHPTNPQFSSLLTTVTKQFMNLLKNMKNPNTNSILEGNRRQGAFSQA